MRNKENRLGVMQLKATLFPLLISIFCATAACATVFGGAAKEVTLVRLKPPPGQVALTARYEGTLEVKNGCVYFVSDSSGAAVLGVWPPTYQLRRMNGKAVGVEDASTGQSLKFGEHAVFGGGEANHSSLIDEIDAPIPHACSGPLGYIHFSF